MRLYHGSNIRIETPEIRRRRALDFGHGFYMTAHEDKAVEFARKVVEREIRAGNAAGIATLNTYELDYEAIARKGRILEFVAADEGWLDFVVSNRQGALIDEPYDLVIGPVANDDVFAVVRLFENGTYTKEEALKRMKVKKLFNQYVITSEDCLAHLRVLQAREV
jgi:hypothetical protein